MTGSQGRKSAATFIIQTICSYLCSILKVLRGRWYGLVMLGLSLGSDALQKRLLQSNLDHLFV